MGLSVPVGRKGGYTGARRVEDTVPFHTNTIISAKEVFAVKG